MGTRAKMGRVVHMVIPLAVLKQNLSNHAIEAIAVVHMVIPLAVWDTVITSQITKAIRWL